MKPVVAVVGDALLDRDVEGEVQRVCPDAPVPVLDEGAARARPGGAALAACLAAAQGCRTILVTALAADPAGAELSALLERAGVEVVDLGLGGTTAEKVRFRAAGQTLLRLDRGGGPGEVGPLTGPARASLERAGTVLVADYGWGVAAGAGVREALAAWSSRRPRQPRLVWDPHPRGARPLPGAVVTPNRREALSMAAALAQPAAEGRHKAAAGGERTVHNAGALGPVLSAGRRLLAGWEAAAVAVTLGPGGALLVADQGPPLVAPAHALGSCDPCGAGDRFAVAVAGALAEGALVSEAVADAVATASAWLAAGGVRAGYPSRPRRRPGRASADGRAPMTVERAVEMAARVRAGGGTVVATGGCFDLLHAGHVATLEAARSLGECLLVCLNTDSSVSRLKGPGRPLVPACERAALLGALSCVDGVVLFEEDTPVELLERLRPDVFAKGGDYGLAPLPEADALAGWGGHAVVLPYLRGRSTSDLLERALAGRRGGGGAPPAA